MEIKEVEKIYSQIKSSQYTELINKLILTAIRYSRLRVDWSLLPLDERINIENERTRAHNAFISSCDALARNMGKAGEDISWRRLLGNDRKNLGDFACLLHAIIGIKAR